MRKYQGFCKKSHRIGGQFTTKILLGQVDGNAVWLVISKAYSLSNGVEKGAGMLATESRMSALKIDPELLRELLNAASRTALTHRGSESEAYVLGQLEATANFAYVLAAGSDNEELELLCQQMALDALNRYSELDRPQSTLKVVSPASSK